MPDLTQQQREFFDLLARLIDAPLQSRDEGNLTPEQRVESRLKQPPYAVEYAVITHLHRIVPGLFLGDPVARFEDSGRPVRYVDATEDLRICAGGCQQAQSLPRPKFRGIESETVSLAGGMY